MVKHLLLAGLAALSAATLSAEAPYSYAQGDEIVSGENTYVVKSANLITNGYFADGMTGWTDIKGNALPADKYAIKEGNAPDGSNSLSVTAGIGKGTRGDGSLYKYTELEPGKTYFASFFFYKGTQYERIALCASINPSDNASNPDAPNQLVKSGPENENKAEWRSVSTLVTPTDAKKFCVMADGWAGAGAEYACFSIHEVSIKIDENALASAIAEAEKYTAVPAENAHHYINEAYDAYAAALSTAKSLNENTEATDDAKAAAINELNATLRVWKTAAECGIVPGKPYTMALNGTTIILSNETGSGQDQGYPDWDGGIIRMMNFVNNSHAGVMFEYVDETSNLVRIKNIAGNNYFFRATKGSFLVLRLGTGNDDNYKFRFEPLEDGTVRVYNVAADAYLTAQPVSWGRVNLDGTEETAAKWQLYAPINQARLDVPAIPKFIELGKAATGTAWFTYSAEGIAKLEEAYEPYKDEPLPLFDIYDTEEAAKYADLLKLVQGTVNVPAQISIKHEKGYLTFTELGRNATLMEEVSWIKPEINMEGYWLLVATPEEADNAVLGTEGGWNTCWMTDRANNRTHWTITEVVAETPEVTPAAEGDAEEAQMTVRFHNRALDNPDKFLGSDGPGDGNVLYYDKSAGNEFIVKANPETSGICDVAVENDATEAPAEYYDLRGIRVNPEGAARGIYIMRQGTKVTKVIK